MAYSPAFQFYPDDFTGDKNTIRMDTLDIGAYWLLICECWDKDNRLPNDLDELAEISRLDRAIFEPIWERKIKRCFQFDERKKFYFHKRIAEEIKKQKSWKKQKSEAGKRGMAKRWKQTTKNDNTDITVLGSDITPNNSSSSSSSSFKPEEEKEEKTLGETDVPQPPPPVKSGSKKPADPRAKHPAIVCALKAAKRYPPKDLWDAIILALGETPDEEFFEASFTLWRSVNGNPLNFEKWLFGPARTGQKPEVYQNGTNSGRSGQNQRNDADVLREGADYIRQKYGADGK